MLTIRLFFILQKLERSEWEGGVINKLGGNLTSLTAIMTCFIKEIFLFVCFFLIKKREQRVELLTHKKKSKRKETIRA